MRDMQLLVSIDEHRSISAAAAALGLTQPAASRTLMEIEQALRVHLFERERSKGMVATVAGGLVLARARTMLADCELMAMELDALRAGIGGQLRLGVIPFAPSLLMERVITGLTGPAHRMSLAVTEGSTTQLLQELHLQRLDAIIARCSSTELGPGLARDTLYRQDACLVAHADNPLVRRGKLRMKDLEGHAWLLPARGTPSRIFIDEAFAAARMAPPLPIIEAGASRIIHLMVRAHPNLLAIVPSDVARDLEHMGSVRGLPFPAPLKMPLIGLVFAARHRDSPLIRTLRASVREALHAGAPA